METSYWYYFIQTSKYVLKHYLDLISGKSHIRKNSRFYPEAKIILMAGNPRSGSTAQYNLVRLALKQGGYKVYASNISEYVPSTKADYHIVKLHLIDKKLIKKASLIFTSSRDFEGVKRSYKRIYGSYKKKELIRNFFLWMEWDKYCDYSMSYGEFMSNKEKVVRDTLNTLNLGGLNEKKLIKDLDSLEPPKGKNFKNYYDPETLLHAKHISSKK